MNQAIPVIIFLGAPGAGKGTQALRLSQTKRIPRISTGDMLRQAVQDDSELGRKVKGIMQEGRLVADETMLNLVESRISKPDCQTGFVLDGYPRNLHQAQQLETVLTPNMQPCVFRIDVSEDEIVRRVAGRRTCPRCERIYNIYFHRPKDDEKCDQDGAALFRRDDDDEDVVRRRIDTYQEEIFPLIDYYRKKGVLHVVDGVQSEEKVSKEIHELLG